ncbi:MAG TPA: hypothetical protein VFH51_11150, partial [Myxococcota bacterium]|nr:hypothetical protein [Myxococcota bacterium]
MTASARRDPPQVCSEAPLTWVAQAGDDDLLKARREAVLASEVRVRVPKGGEQWGRADDIITGVEAALARGPRPCMLDVALGGGAVTYLAGREAHFADVDDFALVSLQRTEDRLEDGRAHVAVPPLTYEEMKSRVGPAVATTLQDMFGAAVSFATFERHTPQGSVFVVRIGMPDAHMDLRFALADSNVLPYDYLCNSLKVARADLRKDGAPPPLGTFGHASVEQVLDDLRLGLFAMDHALLDGLVRDWKMRVKGFVPKLPAPGTEAPDYFAALLPGLLASLQEEGQKEGMTLNYAISLMVNRARALVGATATDPTSRPALAMVANAVLSVSQADSSVPGVEPVVAELRRNLESCAREAKLDGAARAFLDQLEADAPLQALTLWLHAVALPHSAYDAREVPPRYEVRRVETPGGASLRVYLPELRSYVVLRDQPHAARGAYDALPDIKRVVGMSGAQAVREALTPAGRAVSFAALVPAGFGRDVAAKDLAASRLVGLYREASTAPLAFRARLLLAAAKLGRTQELSTDLEALATELQGADAAL